MAKKKDSGGGSGGGGSGGGGCRPAHSRVSFLFQAAALLASTPALATEKTTTTTKTKTTTTGTAKNTATAAVPSDRAPAGPPLQSMSRRLLVQMRAVSRKTNMRVRPGVKQRVCRYCDTLLVEGATCTSTVENASRGGRKPWADLLVVACHTCGRAARRYPVSAPRQPRRPMRGGGEEKETTDGGPGGQDGAAQRQPGAKGRPMAAAATDRKSTSKAKAKAKSSGQQAPAGRAPAAGKTRPG